MAFHLGPLNDSSLKMRRITDCSRILCAVPKYIGNHGNPADGAALVNDNHACLILRYPGAQEFRWTLQTENGPKPYDVTGPFESDDGDILTDWALQGHGIILRPVFEIASHLHTGALVPVAVSTPPLATQLVCLYPPHKLKDKKVQLFVDFISGRCKAEMARQNTGL